MNTKIQLLTVNKLCLNILIIIQCSCSLNHNKLTNKELRSEVLSSKTVFDKSVLVEESRSLSSVDQSGSIGGNLQNSNSNGTISGSIQNTDTSGMNDANTQNSGSSGTIGGNTQFSGTNGTIGGGLNIINNTIPVNFLCSTRRTINNNGNLREASEQLKLTFLDKNSKKVICSETNDTLKNHILIHKSIPIPTSCSNLLSFSNVSIKLGETDLQNFIYAQKKIGTVTFSGNSDFSRNNNSLYVLLNRYKGEQTVDENCDKMASPLFIDLGTSQTLILSSPETGIKFDILGENSFPLPYSKKKISWFSNESFMFLVNPSKGGIVSGINQMFGDNTLGPDNAFSSDGFNALAKHDLNKDNIIDKEDPIFTKLRLWSDANSDGIATPGELFTLEFLKIKAIELEFDSNYFEKDIYGNEIRYKSLIQMNDGSIKLMFDLWFRYL